jgi:superkiller protein 3
MSLVKSKLKLARDSINRKDFATARDAANQVLDFEPQNYHASVPTTHIFDLMGLNEPSDLCFWH